MRTRELRPGWFFRRGDIYLANLNPFTGSEQGGTRPVLVLQNNDGNFYCPTLIVAPMTTQIKKLNQPTHYLIKNNRALSAPSMVEFEQIKTIDKSRIKGYLGKLTKEQLRAAGIVEQSSKELIHRICNREGYTVLNIGKPERKTLEVNLNELWGR